VSAATATGAPPRGPPRYVAWAGAVSATSGALELASGLATALSLPAGTEVALEPLPGLASAAAVEVEPAATEDWEVLELNAGLLEDVLLGQARGASDAADAAA
jgi:peroxin-1